MLIFVVSLHLILISFCGCNTQAVISDSKPNKHRCPLLTLALQLVEVFLKCSFISSKALCHHLLDDLSFLNIEFPQVSSGDQQDSGN